MSDFSHEASLGSSLPKAIAYGFSNCRTLFQLLPSSHPPKQKDEAPAEEDGLGRTN